MPVADQGAAPAVIGESRAPVKKSRSGAPLGKSGAIPARATVYPEPEVEAAPTVEEMLSGRANPNAIFNQAMVEAATRPVESSYDDLVSGRPEFKIGDTERSDLITSVGDEARAAGIKGRGVQSFMQERLGQPGTEDYLRPEIARREKVDVERQMTEAADKSMRRGINQGAGTGTEALTLEQYQALNPKQRAAVDLNTMLVAAVKEDLSSKVQGSNPGGKQYDDQVAELGLEGDRYAPETVELLDRINYDGSGAKLNDFLKLKVGFTANDLEDLEPEQGGPDLSLKTSMKQRETLQAALVNAIKGVRKDPANGNALLTQQRDLLGTSEQPGFGAANPQGTIDEQRNYFFQDMFERLARTDEKGSKELLRKIETESLTDPADWQAFQAYLQVRSRESKQYSMPLGADPEADYASPKIFRANTGLNR